VGRLDFLSEGLLILTNDGDFTRFMTLAGGAAKVYGIKVSGVPSSRTLDRLRRGTRIEGRSYAPCEIRTVSEDTNSWYEVTLHEGQNRQLRRMFEALGHRVMRLRRTQIGFLTAPTLAPGKWRQLTGKEVQEFYRRYGSDPESYSQDPIEVPSTRAPAVRGKTPVAGRRQKRTPLGEKRPAGAGRKRPTSGEGERAAGRGRKRPTAGEGERAAGRGRKRPTASQDRRAGSGRRQKPSRRGSKPGNRTRE
jgi:pseudouridine synthase